jgi:sugar lactone lactonase YvrE
MHGLDQIGRMSTLGQSLEVFGPTGGGPSGIALGPDGALWFAETKANKIGRMTTTGRITEFALPFDPSGPNEPGEIVAGPDGAMWFTESGVNKIGRIDAGSSTSAFVPPPFVPPLQITTTKKPTPAKSACRVPKVRGLRIGQARKKLRRAKCRFRIRGKGRVFAIRPRAGVRTRTTVQLKAKRR